MSLVNELKRRNVFKVGAAYVVMAWLLAQGVDVFLENFGAPDWVIKTILLLLVAGFPVAVFFAWAFELTPEGIKKEKDVDRSQSITHKTGRKLDFVVIGLLLVALGYFAVDKFVLVPARHAAEQTATTESEPDGPKTIAVLPFVNMSEDRGNEYFSDGISEEILNALARVPELQVAGRTSSFAFKGENVDLRRIGETLGVDHILEGSVRKAGATVRITAQLIQVDNGFHLWSDSYDRNLDDVFAIQDEIANAILTELKARLVGDTPVAVASARTDSEAYDLYLLAKQRMYERAQLPLENAAELLDRAIAIDPDYAPAYAQRSVVAHLLSESQYGALPVAQADSQARLFAEKALQLNPGLAEGWAALGLYQLDRPGEIVQAIENLEKALALNPALIDAANWLHNAYNQTTQPAEALKVIEDVHRRDPLYRPALGNLAWLYVAMDRRDRARAIIEGVRPYLSQDANMLWLDGMMFESAGEIAKAMPLLERAVELSPQDRVYRIQLGMSLLQTHQYERAADEGYWWTQAQALRHLGRVEEATLLTQKWAGEGDVEGYFRLLNATGRSEILTEYLESRWADVAAFAQAFPAFAYFGYGTMLEVALAYQKTGQPVPFDSAMALVRTAHDSLTKQGISNPYFYENEATYFALAGDRIRALDFLGRAVDAGRMFSRSIADDLPAFRDFEGDPEYEAIEARMIEHLNRERSALGLEPVST
ncbi:tetratricopeptide repeat protein [Elongatibacter sediminis]|uniref:Tetratricopeptide repeat protein n=1 Tax=Elongatibacter sediminis TaxID=3119006 RepID=A0AAW9RH06_9GAMM